MTSYRNRDVAKLEQKVHITFKRETLSDNNDWYTICRRVVATVLVPIGGSSFTIFEFASAGIWDAEFDCDEEYENELFVEQESTLKDAMRAMGTAFAALEG